MMPYARTLMLAGLAALVLGANAYAQVRRPLGVAPNAPAAAPAPAAAEGETDKGLPALEDLTATRERPLFSSTRRPPEAEPPPQAAATIVEAASMPFELVGIVLGADMSAAIFRNTDTKEETRVPKGDKIGDWSVDDISDRAVVLRGRDKRVRMRLFNEASAPGVQVGRVGEDGKPVESEPAPAASEDDGEVDEDITPSNSPAVRPATAQPKPPPSARNPRNARQHPPPPPRLGRADPRRLPRPPQPAEDEE